MATVDHAFAQRLISGNGRLPEHQDEAPDNPRVLKVVEYTNTEGGLAYGIVFDREANPNRYEVESQYIRKPKVIWEYKP